MKNLKTPLTLDGVKENIYAGFWSRLGAILLDALLGNVFWLLVLYPLTWDNSYLSHLFGNLLSFSFFCFTSIYLVQLIGASPGKWLMNIKIIKLNGQAANSRAALLREIVTFVQNFILLLYGFYLWGVIDHAKFESLGDDRFLFADYKQSQYLFDFMGEEKMLMLVYILGGWMMSELIVLLFNKRKRALHDFIAGTVVIKKRYESALREEMGLDSDSEEFFV